MRRERSSMWGVLVSASLLHFALPSHGSPRATLEADDAMPGPARGGPTRDRIALNRECVTCHDETAAQWEGSLHQRSFVDHDVALAMAREPRPFCRSCHAPEADPQHAPPAPAAAIGVACVTCHVPLGAELPVGGVLAAPATSVGAEAPHPVVRRAAFASTAACGGCHEFASPREPGVMLQSTLREHRRSAFASESCQACHMPRGDDGRRAHGFPASRDPFMLRSALHATARRIGDDVMVELGPAAVGHAFPTGDPFRRLAVELGRDDGEWVVIDTFLLTRHIATNAGHGRVEIADDRPGASSSPTRVPLHAPGLAAHALRWRVVYERADMDHPEDEDPRLFGRVVVAEGRLPPAR